MASRGRTCSNIFLTTVTLVGFADAFPSYGTKVPNGQRVPCPEGAEGCTKGDVENGEPEWICFGLGHRTCQGATMPLNPWGEALKNAGFLWTKDLCEGDADGDGWTNGQELGDPCCEWSEGNSPSQYMLDFTPSHPGFDSDTPSVSTSTPQCGNAVPTKNFLGQYNDGEIQKNVTFQIKNYQIPAEETTYIDVFFNFNDNSAEIFDIIGGDVIITQPKHLHHFVVTGCQRRIPLEVEGIAHYRDGMEDYECYHRLGGFAGWAPGAPLFGLPQYAGVPIGRGVNIVAFQINVHFTDGDKPPGPGSISNDGITIHYTPTLRPMTIRQNIIIGVGGSDSVVIPPQTPRWFFTRSCTVTTESQRANDEGVFLCRDFDPDQCETFRGYGSCGEDWAKARCPRTCGVCQESNEFTVWGSFHHAHLLGREMYLVRDNNGTVEDFGSMRNWHFDDQSVLNMESRNLTLRVGDKLQTTCVFNSMERDGPTVMGRSTYDEMCFNNLVTLHARSAMPSSITFAFVCKDDEPAWSGTLGEYEDGKLVGINHPLSEATDVWRMNPNGEAEYKILKYSALKPLVDHVFAMFDSNSDGYWSPEEWTTAMSARAIRGSEYFNAYSACWELGCTSNVLAKDVLEQSISSTLMSDPYAIYYNEYLQAIPEIYVGTFDFATALQSYADSSVDCPSDSWIPFKGSCYHVVNADYYASPEQSCENLAEEFGLTAAYVHLPCIHSEEEQNLVSMLSGLVFAEMLPGLPWFELLGELAPLGMKRRSFTSLDPGWVPENWQCPDGKPVDYANFFPGHPEDGRASYAALHHQSGYWIGSYESDTGAQLRVCQYSPRKCEDLKTNCATTKMLGMCSRTVGCDMTCGKCVPSTDEATPSPPTKRKSKKSGKKTQKTRSRKGKKARTQRKRKSKR